MRVMFSVIFALLIIALGSCAVAAISSRKSKGKAVALLNSALIPPVMGNLIIIVSTERMFSNIGCYIYFVGMDMVMFALLIFTFKYCKGFLHRKSVPFIYYVLLGADAVQLLLNPIFGHAFSTEGIDVEGSVYYRLVPHFGQSIHRIVDYFVFFTVLLIFTIMVFRTTNLYREKYSVILGTMILGGLWQTFYIFSRTPVDTSMIGFGIFGLLIFYFSLYYRPLRLLDRILSNIASEMPEALYVFDPAGNCVWANEQGCRLLRIRSSELDKATDKLIDMFGDAGSSDEGTIAERSILTEGITRYYTLEEHKVTDESNRFTGSYLRIREITEEKNTLMREMYEANHDFLTGLYTREYLYKQISGALDRVAEREYIVIFLDVKDFKVVNDIFGVDFGDHALKCIAEYVRRDMSENCYYGRLSGDTFGVFMPKDEFDPEKIEDALAKFIVRSDMAEHHLLMHLGIYDVDKSDTDVSVMFDRAHLALATIKDEFHTHIAYYDDEIRKTLMWNQEISAQLHDAIESRQLRPYLQPIADREGTIIGAEALVRWEHPEHGFLSPLTFIPVFEKNGMIVEVDRYMWRSACEILKKWEKEGSDLFISVNISPKDFYFADVVSEIKELVSEYGISPAKLRIEITETVMMNEAEHRMNLLKDLREAGFIVEMDDFGSGYSSLSMLKDMPVDVLKIDMKFLGKTNDVGKAQTIVKNIINLSKELGIASLTEGVDNQVQYQVLSEMGCMMFQGYYFAAPMPVHEFEEFAKTSD